MRFLLAFVLSFVSLSSIAQAPPMILGGPQGINVTKSLVTNWLSIPNYVDTPVSNPGPLPWPGRGYIIQAIKNYRDATVEEFLKFQENGGLTKIDSVTWQDNNGTIYKLPEDLDSNKILDYVVAGDTAIWHYTGKKWNRVGGVAELYFNSLISGGFVTQDTPYTSRKFSISSSEYYIKGVKYNYDTLTQVIAPQKSSNSSGRIDVIVLTPIGVKLIKGEESTTPYKPRVDAESIELTTIYFKPFDSIPSNIGYGQKGITNIYRIPGKDSIYFTIDTLTFSIKDSVTTATPTLQQVTTAGNSTNGNNILINNGGKLQLTNFGAGNLINVESNTNGIFRVSKDSNDSTIFSVSGNGTVTFGSSSGSNGSQFRFIKEHFSGNRDRTLANVNGTEVISINGQTADLEGRVNISTPTLQQVTDAGYKTNDTLHVISNGDTTLISLIPENFVAGKRGFLRIKNSYDDNTLSIRSTGIRFNYSTKQKTLSFGSTLNSSDVVTLPDTSGTLAASIKLNNSIYQTASNGVVDLGLLQNPVVALNGITKTSDTLKLGGTITENTNITLSSRRLSVIAGSDTARFFANGSVNIGGTATDSTYKLNVNGNTRVTGYLDLLPSFNNNTSVIRNQASNDGSIMFVGQGSVVSSTPPARNVIIDPVTRNYSSLTGSANTLIGRSTGQTLTNGVQNTFIGFNAGNGVTTGSNNIIIVNNNTGAPYQSTVSNSIILQANVEDSALLGLTNKYSFIGGGDNGNNYINDFYFGGGHRARFPESSHLNFYAPSAWPTITDTIGSNFTINAGRGSGTGLGGSVIFSTSSPTTSGTTLQTLSERARITPSGNLLVGTSSDSTFRLNVSGRARISDTLTLSTTPVTADTSANDLLVINSSNGQVRRYTGDWYSVPLTGSATLDFPSTGHGNSADLTITVTGASEGDVVALGIPNASIVANASFTAWVSSTNTVTVRFNNYASSGSSDPASGTFKIKVLK